MAGGASAERPSVLGVDVGGTKVLVGLVRGDGTVVATHRHPMDRRDREHTLASILDAVAGYLAEAPRPESPAAIGLGLVGLTDTARGLWLHSMNLRVDRPIDLRTELGVRYGLPVALDNDVHAATLAELRFGVGRECRDFIYLNVGTGLAGGIVCNGHLVRGTLNYAGELGHSRVADADDLCPCGRRGCVEMYASGGAIVDHVCEAVKQGRPTSLAVRAASGALTSADVFLAADSGDELAREVADRAVRGIGDMLVNLVNMLNPAAIVLGGGVVADGWLAPRLDAFVRQTALRNATRHLRQIAPSSLPVDQVGLLGAATLALDALGSTGEHRGGLRMEGSS